MNTDFMTKLADMLDRTRPGDPVQRDVRLNMDVFYRKEDCGTYACLAGHAVLLACGLDKLKDMYLSDDDIESSARHLMGLSASEAALLFWPSRDIPWEGITPQEAAAAIRRMVNGEHPWGEPPE